MPSSLNNIGRLLAFALIVLSAAAALPQSRNREAMKWFDAGLAEKNIDKRIEAYSQAVALDPNFAEALFNLGAACKEQKSYERAEQWLARAANASKGDLRVKALSELASVYNIRGNGKSAENALREAKTLAGDPKQRAVLSYELGRLLYQQGRYAPAVAELKDGRAADPAQREAFDNLLALAENLSQLDDLYALAEKQKTAGNLQEAQTTLEQIKAKNANFRDVQTKLHEVQTLLAIDAGKTAIVPAPPAAEKAEVDDGETEKNYVEGLAATRKRDWAGAIAAFEKTLQLHPDYRDAGQKLAEAQMYFERDRIEAIAARYYDEGVAALDRYDLDSALALLGKVQKINRRYRDVAILYAQVEAAQKRNAAFALSTPLRPESTRPALDTLLPANLAATKPVADSIFTATPFNVTAALDSLYQSACAAVARGDWSAAVAHLQKIRRRQANYRDADELFVMARSKLLKEAVATAEAASFSLSRPSPVMIGGLVIAAAISFAAGFVFFAPTARARYQSRRGNDDTAVLIYESLLARRPSRMKLYPQLAEIYLRLDRRDEAAVQVYRRVLELNLPSAHRADMSAIIALNTGYEKTTNGALTAKAVSLRAGEVGPANGMLLVDDGFQVKEKMPTRRPRKKKETLEGTAVTVVSENGETASSELLMDGVFSLPAKTRKPRKKKEIVATGSAESGAPAGDLAQSVEPLSNKAPARKPRRRKVFVVDTASASETPANPVEAMIAAPPEIDLPVESQIAQDEPAPV